MKTILVAIPNFNNSKFIEETIHSVLSQKTPIDSKLDIVVFDNASTDNSVDVINRLISNHRTISLIINPNNIGAIANHNLCVDYAIRNNYDYLKILSSDDVLIHDAIYKQTMILVEDHRVNLVSCSMIVTDENLNNCVTYSFMNTDREIFKVEPSMIMFDCMAKTKNLFGGPSNFMIRVAAVTHVRFTMKFSWLSDLQFAFDVISSGDSRFAYVNNPGFFYRRHSNTDTSSIVRKKGLQIKEWLEFINDNRNNHLFYLRRVVLLSKIFGYKLMDFIYG